MNQRIMQDYHDKLCEQLGIRPAVVEVGGLPWDTMARYHCTYGLIQIHPGKIQRGAGNTKDCTWRWLIAHETYHHYQREKGWLTATHYRGILKSEIAARLPYSRWPHEVAANRYANKVTK